MTRLAVIATHPIQYYAPWFKYIAGSTDIELKVFYLWDFGTRRQNDPGFGVEVKWDLPLMEGYVHTFIPNTAAQPGTNHFRGLRNPGLQEAITDWNPDAIFLMAYRYVSTLSFIFSNRSRVPLIFRGDSHRLHRPSGAKEYVRRTAISCIFSRFAAVLSVGKANREYFVLHGVPPKRIFHSPHAVDNDRLIAARPEAEEEAKRWRTQLGIPADHRVVLFAGKFRRSKRPMDLLLAFRQANLPRCTLLFVGAGELEDDLKECAAGDSRIHFAPFQNQLAMPRTLAAADLVVLPSDEAETWGLILNEAMCLGKPVIAGSMVGAAADLIENERNGLVFPTGDVESLADALRHALADDARLVEWGRRSEQIVSRYSYRHATEGLLQALAAVVPHKAAHR